PVIFATERDSRSARVVGLHHQERAPAIGRARHNNPGSTAFLETDAEFAGRPRQAVPSPAHICASPLTVDRSTETIHVCLRRRHCVLAPILARATGRLRRGHEDELSARRWQPPYKSGAIGEARKNDDRSGEI